MTIRVSRVLVLATAIVAAPACSPRNEEPPSTPLPTRQTTIDPVNKKLDAAAQDVERRRAEIDAAAK